MRPLIFGPEQEEMLRKVRTHAELHPFTRETIQRKVDSGQTILTDETPEFTCEIPFGFVVNFSVEQHPAGWLRHLSVALKGASDGKLPNMAAMKMIGQELGMRMDIFDATTLTRFEGPEGMPPVAVSVLELMEAPKDEP